MSIAGIRLRHPVMIPPQHNQPPTATQATIDTMKTATFELEYTDTFGGEANYCWCKRATITAPATITDRALIRRAKSALCITGTHRKESYGEAIAIYPSNTCTVLFITPQY